MTESKSIEKVFNSFPARLYRDDTEGAGTITWAHLNPDGNSLADGSKLLNSNFLFSKMESWHPMRNENVSETNSNGHHTNPQHNHHSNMFGLGLNEHDTNNIASNRIFSSINKLPEHSLFNGNQSNQLSLLPFAEITKSKPLEPNSTDKAAPITNIQPVQNYFPFVVECRKPLPPLRVEEEPIYVNAKQYERIMKMRLKRAKAGLVMGAARPFERSKNV